MRMSDWSSDVCTSDLLGRGRADIFEEALLGDTEVVDNRRNPDCGHSAVTEDHMHALRRGALFPCEDVCIDAHLDQVLRLRRARLLGIGDLVGEGAEPRRLRHFEQEIRIALPGPVPEGARSYEHTSELQS